jgi:nucleotide sugar dehydrogenase
MPPAPKVAVIGLGKIGLPLAAQYASKGLNVIGCDANPEVVAAISSGQCPVQGEPGLEELVAACVGDGRLKATTDTTAAVRSSRTVVMIVPVGIDAEHRADFRQLDAAAEDVGRGLRAGTLVILETTVPVGTTRNRVRNRLMAASGLRGDAIKLAFSPERVSSGTVFRDLATYPKIVGGVDETSAAAAAAFYTRVLDAAVRVVADPETAEFAKLAESIYRDVNIALANELALAAETAGIDYREAAAVANTQPYSHLHAPGIGVGGHCIPVYPYFLMEDEEPHRLVALSRQINDGMADYGADLLAEALREENGSTLRESTVLILGLAYRGGVKEAAFSSTLLAAAALKERGARVIVHDPLFSDDEISGLGLDPSGLPPAEKVHAVLLQASHAEYSNLDLRSIRGCKVFLDGRRAFEPGKVTAAGVRYVAIGMGRER